MREEKGLSGPPPRYAWISFSSTARPRARSSMSSSNQPRWAGGGFLAASSSAVKARQRGNALQSLGRAFLGEVGIEEFARFHRFSGQNAASYRNPPCHAARWRTTPHGFIIAHLADVVLPIRPDA
jgi:hypothetical protein